MARTRFEWDATKDEENQEDAERENVNAGVARDDFLERQFGPIEDHPFGQILLGELLHDGLGLTRAEVGQKFVRPKLTPVEGATDAVDLRIEVEAEGAPRQFGEAVKVYAGESPVPAIGSLHSRGAPRPSP